MSARTVPFHCPYCGDQNLWPFEARRLAPQEPPHETEGSDAAGHGAWECRDCLRAFQLKSLGLIRPGGAQGAQSAQGVQS